uniref:cytochrome c oxidase subunit II n=1 Tax=Bargmannia lata TaxID=2078594 RepID=UPI0026E1C305|nr:cytochrome c oxidase subunit II [Bargmannia lata]WJJ70052.1 cytochrome c oxidase subunit 2 [Bargmannia lata]
MNSDIAENFQLSWQDIATNSKLLFFHDNVMFIIVLITIIVGWIMIRAFSNKFFVKNLDHGSTIEVIWTLIPAIILFFIALPSLKLLYSLDEIINPSLTIKIIGHQWYWSYEYNEHEFDSYLNLPNNGFRLLEVDKKLILPIKTEIRMIITGADVIHCFSVPSLGLKSDAIPGRLNQLSLFIKRPGIFYGQCSEICGSDHSFMPILIMSQSLNKWR